MAFDVLALMQDLQPYIERPDGELAEDPFVKLADLQACEAVIYGDLADDWTGTDFVDRPPEWGREQVNHYTDVNYHQPSDEYDDSWNFDGMIDDALLGFWAGLAIANADEMPQWAEGDEFEAARLESLDAVSE